MGRHKWKTQIGSTSLIIVGMKKQTWNMLQTQPHTYEIIFQVYLGEVDLTKCFSYRHSFGKEVLKGAI